MVLPVRGLTTFSGAPCPASKLAPMRRNVYHVNLQQPWPDVANIRHMHEIRLVPTSGKWARSRLRRCRSPNRLTAMAEQIDDAPSTGTIARLTGAGMAEQDADAAQLAALGYTAKFDRSMSVWENFALGFTYLSPVVGVYSVFDRRHDDGRAADVLVLFPRRRRTVPRLPHLLRGGVAVSDFRRALPLGAATGRQEMGMDGRLDLWLGAVHHHRRGGGRRGTVRRHAARLRWRRR